MEEVPESPRVISLFDRQPYEPPEPEATEAKPVEPNEEEVALLESILEQVKAGHVVGLVIAAGMVGEHDTIEFVKVSVSTPVMDHYQQFVGAFEEVKHDLLDTGVDVYFEEDET